MADNILKRKVEEKEEGGQEQYIAVSEEVAHKIVEKNATNNKFNSPKIAFFQDDRRVTKPTYVEKPEPLLNSPAIEPVNKNKKYQEKTETKGEGKKQQYEEKPEPRTEGKKPQYQEKVEGKKQQYEEKVESKKQKYSAKPSDYDSRYYRIELVLPKKLEHQKNLLYIENNRVQMYVQTAKQLLKDYAFMILKAYGNNVQKAVQVSQSLASEYSQLKRVNIVAEEILEEHHIPIGEHGKQFYTKVSRASMEIKMSLVHFELNEHHIGFQDCQQPEKRNTVNSYKKETVAEPQIEETIQKDRRGYQQKTSNHPREYGKNRKVYREKDFNQDRRQPVGSDKRTYQPREGDRREEPKRNRYQERPMEKRNDVQDERDYR